MQRVIKDEFGLRKVTKILFALGFLTFFFVSVFVYVILYGITRNVVMTQAVNSITNISQLNQDSVSRAIENRMTLLEMISDKFGRKGIDDIDRALEDLEGYAEYYDFYSMGILDKDKMLHLTTGSVINVSGYERYEAAWDEETHISASYMPVDGGEYAINLLSCPIFDGDSIEYVLTASYYSKNLTERMNLSSINEKGYNFLLNSQGDVVIYPRKYEDEAYNGLMKHINATPQIIPDNSGDRYFDYNGESYYSHFEQLGINDWYLMTCVKEDDVFEDARTITHLVLIGMGILWLMIVAGIIATIYSIYRSKRDIRQAVFYDELLGIGNGSMLSVFFRKLPEDEFLTLAVTVFDVDKFKEFNYIYGHHCGDELLKYIVRVFDEELPEDYLFRMQADEFTALIHCRDKKEYIEKIEKVLARFHKDIEEGTIQYFDISAGARKLCQGDTLRLARSDALIAKGTIKGIQVQQYAFYEESVLQKRMNYMEMESDFSRALRDNEFHVYYQPKYDMYTKKIVGAEALVRWIKSDGTMRSPGEFVPCFEESRQIILLDEAMLLQVCHQMKAMEDDGLDVQKVSVNLSRVHLKQHGILPKIEKIVKESGINPEKLSFEITESALYEDSIPLKNIIDSIHNLGCKVDMDDYGVGVSNPNALAANRFDVLKLDKSFVDGIGDARMEAVIRSTIRLSKDLGMEILAEGVEAAHQAEFLVKWGCVMAQGFYYSPPVSEKEYRRLLKENVAAN